MSNIERKVKSELIFKGHVITVCKDEVELVGLDINSFREVVIHNGGVCAVVKLKNNKIAFVKQYRYAVGTETLELPAGKIEKGEDPDVAIVREIEEEVGVIPKKIIKKGFVFSSPGFCTERIYLYYIDDYETTSTHFDFDESLDYFEYTYNEALELVDNGIISDAKTVALLLRCRHYFI